MLDHESSDSVGRIERAMRSFKRLGDAQRVQRGWRSATGIELDATGLLALMRIDEHGSLRLTELAPLLWLDLSVVSRKVRQLEEMGLVMRTPDPADARASQLKATPSGAATVARMMSHRRDMLEATVGTWTEADREQLAELLERFVHDVVNSYEDHDQS
ncbi:MAG: transcriptional regulator MarR family [Thermoleophilia bacterium]|nr:transcriptional regulator MarR family [Thermoleophilia bacterium]MCZ4496340.1 transcriptional regulator MarR family [Thermoleophilia bacterium]